MSRVYFHSPSGDAELLGREFYWLGHLAAGPAKAAWDLDGSGAFERACDLLKLAPEVPDGDYGANYLHKDMRAAMAQEERNKAIYAAWRPGTPLGRSGADHGPSRFLVEALKTRLAVDGLELALFGVRLHTTDIGLNTALLAGSDQVALAAKIHGWCVKHTWLEGPDRAWLACDDEPVVLSHSVDDSFPNSSVGDWMPPWPEGVARDWNALTEEQQAQRSRRDEEWYELPDERQWEISMAGLRSKRPWARLSADTLRSPTFSLPVTVYDVTAADRDERLRAVLADHPDYREPAVSASTC